MAGVLDYVLKIRTLIIHGSGTGLKLTRPLSRPQVATQLSTRTSHDIEDHDSSEGWPAANKYLRKRNNATLLPSQFMRAPEIQGQSDYPLPVLSMKTLSTTCREEYLNSLVLQWINTSSLALSKWKKIKSARMKIRF